jgi:hypothetical protein
MGAEHEPVLGASVLGSIDIVIPGRIGLLSDPESPETVTRENTLERIWTRAEDFRGEDVAQRPVTGQDGEQIERARVARDLSVVQMANAVIGVRRASCRIEITATRDRPTGKVGVVAVRRFKGTRP